ncbi:uncharacterized protein KY384_003045 [Bacidia gigantensis]|uniref:uncharacterized protein n=1 Tax=Bacidia gigantensis TaxID=2732470 RepID=UPI001D03C573|nr:uncharacterized protein KY384_003045 [Bacidia gigantensis]KAG8531416.1 hypothetical protein KY384_003045 [Bacidia gigantensis]
MSRDRLPRSPSVAPSNLSKIDRDSKSDVSGADSLEKPGPSARLGLKGEAIARAGGGHRTASPAKRRASEMNGQDGDVKMTGDEQAEAEPDGAFDPSASIRRANQGPLMQHVVKSSSDATDQGSTEAASRTSQNGGSRAGFEGIAPASGSDPPSIDDQITKVLALAQGNWLEEGVKAYLVASNWLERVLSRGKGEAKNHSKGAQEGPIGPVDNSSIWLDTDAAAKYEDEKGEEFIFLKPQVTLRDDFELLPQEAWDLIIKWYGKAEGSPIITRYCHNTSTNEYQDNLQFELLPPIFTVLKLPDTTQGLSPKDLKEKGATPVKLLASRHDRYVDFLKRAKKEANIDMATKVRVWRIMGGLGDSQQDGMLTPAQSRSTSPAPGFVPTVDPGDKLVIDLNTFSQLQLGSHREVIDAKDETHNPNYNGKSTLDLIGLRQPEVIVLEEMIGGPCGGEWISDASTAKAQQNGIAISVTKAGSTTVKDSLKPSAASSRGVSPAPAGMMTRGRQNMIGKIRGTTGLGNQGNTCYMNSALQCVRSVQELTLYFLEDNYKPELNPSNPLSHNGDVAKTYAKLLHEMYDPKQNSSFTPRNFKNVIGKYGPSFSGYQQQDSQEFLLFLLDGLQEDLNRIHKKPYIEKPDSTDEMVNNPAALREMADKCWEIYKKRNDSVITDLFAGMYKSTLVCPVCDKVSIIFDPFNNLTLQLPIQNIWSKNIWFFPLRAAPFQVAVDIDKNAPWSALADYFAQKLDLDPRRLMMAEVWQNKFYKIFESKKSINEDNPSESDHIGCFELEDTPTNWPATKKQKKSVYYPQDEEIVPEGDSPLADRMLVTLFNRRPKNSHSRFSSREFFGAPSLMIITREEARDYDAILKKCLSRVETLTTRDFLREEEAGDSVTDDSDTIVLNADDSSDGKVQTESLESEDGMVDISTKDDHTDPPPNFQRKPVANMLRPRSFITPGVRNLFEARTFSPGSEMVPLGFQTFMSDDDKKLPSLASRASAATPDELQEDTRASQFPAKDAYKRHMDRLGQDTPPSSDEDGDLPPPAQPLTATLDDDDDDEGLPDVEQIIQKPVIQRTAARNNTPANRRLVKNTYAKRDKRKGRTPNPVGFDGASEELPDSSQPLLRLGECIVLDWTEEGYDALFGGMVAMDEDGPARGLPTWDDLPVHPDPELEEKRKLRAQRRKTGFSLGDCLDEFGKPEILSENDAWFCPRCKEHRRASKTFELWKAPDVLVIHLKRFSTQGRLNNKLDVFVDFPLEGLDLSSRLATPTDDDKPPIYELFAVDNHYGGLGGGHYTAYAKNFIDKRWYEYNDSFVTPRKDEGVITPAAYLLFYHEFSRAFPKPEVGGRQASRRLLRNGLSSALPGVEAAHQAGGGGPVSVDPTAMVLTKTDGDDEEDEEEELPPYSAVDRNHDRMEMDDHEDEGISMADPSNGGMRGGGSMYEHPAWSFNSLDENLGTPINNQNATNNSEEENDKESMNAASGGSIDSDGHDRMADFLEDQGTTMNAFGTPPVGDIPDWNEEGGMIDESPVAEVRVSPPTEGEKAEGEAVDEKMN